MVQVLIHMKTRQCYKGYAMSLFRYWSVSNLPWWCNMMWSDVIRMTYSNTCLLPHGRGRWLDRNLSRFPKNSTFCPLTTTASSSLSSSPVFMAWCNLGRSLGLTKQIYKTIAKLLCETLSTLTRNHSNLSCLAIKLTIFSKAASSSFSPQTLPMTLTGLLSRIFLNATTVFLFTHSYG